MLGKVGKSNNIRYDGCTYGTKNKTNKAVECLR